MSTSHFNRRWATLIITALTRQGIGHFCIAPGSRSTPLTLAAAEDPTLQCHTHFDERGLGHFALGLAKVVHQPVAIIVTSGTAVANLYPAIIEAGLTGERLVVLSADRPPELIDCGANQAIEQPGLFSRHPSASINLPRPSPDIPARWLLSTLDSALGQLTGGALHINCPFAEPLYGPQEDRPCAWSQALGEWWQGTGPWLTEQHRTQVCIQSDWSQWQGRKGVIIAGKMTAPEGQRLAQWAQALGWPLIADVLSQTGQPLPCADLWLTHPQAIACLEQCEIVIQFGAHLTGKRVIQWLQRIQPAQFWLIDPGAGRLDPAHHFGRRLVSNITAWLAAHPPQGHFPWAAELLPLAQQTAQAVAARTATYGEGQIAQRFNQLLPLDGQVFIGNSLIIRLIDAFGQLPGGYPVYANRGASGIDGLIATAAGVAAGNGRATLAIVGDISALYDINSLALLRQSRAPFVLMVINNNGGQIFSLLPTPQAQRDRFYTLPQNVNFRHAAALFDLDYYLADSWLGLTQRLAAAWQQNSTLVVEVEVPPTAGADVFRQLLGELNP